MATQKQKAAARRNVKKAQARAKRKQTLKHLSSRTRTALGKEANAVRKGEQPTRRELEAEARRLALFQEVIWSRRRHGGEVPAIEERREVREPPRY